MSIQLTRQQMNVLIDDITSSDERTVTFYCPGGKPLKLKIKSIVICGDDMTPAQGD